MQFDAGEGASDPQPHVKIVIPVYKPLLSPTERVALQQCFAVLGHYPIVIVKPESLSLEGWQEPFRGASVVSFPDPYFEGLSGYNRFMLSPDFYEAFLDTEYILIYQLDAFVFYDVLRDWCSQGFDYVGAPWVIRLQYRYFFLRIFVALRSLMIDLLRRPNRSHSFFQVGNGGFSLRKTASHYDITCKMQPRIQKYLIRNAHKSFNEDVFWSLEPKNWRTFSLPRWRQALRFSYDVLPEVCAWHNNGNLPFGCHGWNIRLYYWEPFIRKYFKGDRKLLESIFEPPK